MDEDRLIDWIAASHDCSRRWGDWDRTYCDILDLPETDVAKVTDIGGNVSAESQVSN